MSHPSRRFRAPTTCCRIVVGFVCLILAGSVSGQDPQPPESKTAPPEIDRHLRKLTKVISNAGVKLKRGAGGFSPQGTSSNASPAWGCCAGNLKRIERSVVAIQAMLLQLDNCYDDRGETDSLIAVRLTKSDLRELARAIQAFADAPTSGLATRAMGGVTRTFLNLSDSASDLPVCGVLIDPSRIETSDTTPEPEPESEDGGPR